MRFITAILIVLAVFVVFVHPMTSTPYANWNAVKMLLAVLAVFIPTICIFRQIHRAMISAPVLPSHWADPLALACVRLC